VERAAMTGRDSRSCTLNGDSGVCVERPAGGTAVTPGERRPVRVMHLVHRLTFAGMEAGVLKLANGFDRAVVHPSICSCCPADFIKERLRSDVALFEMNRRAGNDIGFVMKLARLLRTERPDILHTHAWGTLVEGVVAARLASVPIIVHGEHGTLQTSRRAILAQRFLWKRVDQVLSVSSRLTEQMAATIGFPADRIQTIRNGVDAVRFTPDRRTRARAQFGFAPADLVIGTVGRLEPVKGQRSFITALAAMSGRGQAFTAIIVGDGALREELGRQAADLGVDRMLRFLGKRLDVEDVMACLDVFVLSSTSEGLSNTILEAMASGVPVIATQVGGAAELVADGVTGLLVPPAAPEALSRAMSALAGDRDRRLSMGRAGRARAVAEFSLAAMIRSYEDLYVSLVKRRLREAGAAAASGVASSARVQV
jgi:sugar transferase (PEP-CTERM/EpsH1 system associated)